MCNSYCSLKGLRQRGLSLIELIMFIVIVSVGLAGILSVMNTATRQSADPLLDKQALAVAEALLEEVTAMPFTLCDIDPATGDCVNADAIGPEAGEVRGSQTNPFDHVNDYHGLNLAGGSSDIGGGVLVPAGYNAAITVAPVADLGPAGLQTPAAQALLVNVTVTIAANGRTVSLEAYRTLY